MPARAPRRAARTTGARAGRTTTVRASWRTRPRRTRTPTAARRTRGPTPRGGGPRSAGPRGGAGRGQRSSPAGTRWGRLRIRRSAQVEVVGEAADLERAPHVIGGFDDECDLAAPGRLGGVAQHADAGRVEERHAPHVDDHGRLPGVDERLD